MKDDAMTAEFKFPLNFAMEFSRIDPLTHQIRMSQLLPRPPEEVFSFLEDPRNLPGITPPWLRFTVDASDREKPVSEGALFHYRLCWLGTYLQWQCRIVDYRPPERFTDVQVKGPYGYWKHLHIFERVTEGTLIRDEVTYRIPLGGLGLLIHHLVIRKELEEIFLYRAGRITEWGRV